MMDDETWLNAKKAGIALPMQILFDQKKDDGEQPEAMIYTPVTYQFVSTEIKTT